MRFLVPVLALALGASALPGSALAADGGGVPAEGDSTAVPAQGGTGGAEFGRARRGKERGSRRRRGKLVLTEFSLKRRKLFFLGRPGRVIYRIEGRARRAQVRLHVKRPGVRRPVRTIRLGTRRTGVTHSIRLTGREGGALPQGRYVLRLSARDRRGRGLRRAASIARVVELRFLHHRFPLAGSFNYGGSGARFGAPRSGHTHQGQDLAAAEGTPIVAPRGGVVETVQYQASGAGHYAVLDGAREDRDYVFMHMRSGSVRVRAGQRVRTGQRIGEVGNTGRSFGAHLHFEVWRGGWFASRGRPVDPLPLLRAWDRWS